MNFPHFPGLYRGISCLEKISIWMEVVSCLCDKWAVGRLREEFKRSLCGGKELSHNSSRTATLLSLPQAERKNKTWCGLL